MRHWLLLLLVGVVSGFSEPELVVVGRVPADTLDATGQDTLGGFFSAMAVEPNSWTCSNAVCAGTLFGLVDRGFGDGTQDYRPRIEVFRCTIDRPARRVTLTNTAAIFLTDTNGVNFSGLSTSPHRLDPEGLARRPDGDFFVCEEYGPAVLRFNAAGRLQERLPVPEIYRQRRDNHGFEGLTLTPAGKLVTILQSPLPGDGDNTRILIFENDRPAKEVFYPLHVDKKQMGVSEILALDENRFLVIERDNGGLGGDKPPVYKRINLFDISTNPPRKSDFIDLLQAGIPPAEFPEKWEGLAVLRLPGETLLLVGTDNDFKARTVIHNGVKVGENTTVVDTRLLVYRLRQ